jgi:hypothetical protein
MPYPTDPRAATERATRFFARPESFTLECPRCGTVYRVKVGIKSTHWDPTTSLFKCTAKVGCGKVYLIGLLAWPVSPRAWIKGVPRDQVPHPRQLAQMRKEGGGWWLPDDDRKRFTRVDESNLTLEPERPEKDEDDDDDHPDGT